MSMRRFTTLAAALIAGASFAAGTALPASAAAAPHAQGVSARTFVCNDFGTGADAASAASAARLALISDYLVAGTIFLDYDVQNANGTWSAEVTSNCSAIR
jgi:hypothetical protein